jgi:c-di-GMP-specific phosphodiesterase
VATDTAHGESPVPVPGRGPAIASAGLALGSLRRVERELRQHQQVLERVARGEPLAETLDGLCLNVEHHYRGSLCTVLTVDRNAGVLRHCASPSLSREFAEQIDGLPVGEGMGACGTAAARAQVVAVKDVLTDPLTKSFVDLAERFGLGAVWSYPLLTPGGEVLGTFAVYRHRPHTPSDGERRFVSNAANLAALAIDRARSASALQVAANLDSLTGLPNRSRFLEMVSRELQESERGVGLMCLELDRFQQINETLGYITGDHILLEVAARLEQIVGDAGSASRFGSDVFTVMVPAADSRLLRSLADQVLQEVREPLEVDGVELLLTASIGIALGSGEHDALGLVREADAAMHAARTEGPGRRHVYDRKLKTRMLARLRTETEVRRAITARAFVMHYQPIFSIKEMRWSGVEALVRWQHPRRGLIGPDGFIPLAEETGLIVPLGELVFELVGEQAQRWAQTLPNIHIAVNASVVQLEHPSAAPAIERMLDRSGLPPESLMLEVTESALMERLDSTRVSLERLVADGVSVLIDDFGTGYSSLARLGELPISGLKIDRRFIRGLGVDPSVRPVVKAISDLARAYGLEVVAEGIEDQQALAGIVELECDYAQGFYIGRPAVAELIETQLTGPLPLGAGVVA